MVCEIPIKILVFFLMGYLWLLMKYLDNMSNETFTCKFWIYLAGL